MLKTIIISLLPFLVLFSNGSNTQLNLAPTAAQKDSGTMEKLSISSGSVAMNVNLAQLSRGAKVSSRAAQVPLEFSAKDNGSFDIIVMNGELRGALPGTVALLPNSTPSLPAKMAASYQDLVLESLPFGGDYELAIRDQSGFTFFNVAGAGFTYQPETRAFGFADATLLVSPDFAQALGDQSLAGKTVGTLTVSTEMRPIEVTQVVDGEVTESVLPADPDNAGSTPGPDVIVGDLSGLAQYGSSGTQVGLAVGTDSCNAGTVDLHWYQNPVNDHPVIPQNMYRVSANDTTIEQIGQSSVKHAFTALTQNLCGYGCNGVGGTNLGSGCSDPYGASLNSGPNLGSRAWINPFTGYYPRGDDSTSPNNTHTGHNHTGISHRIIVEQADLNTSLNSGAKYLAEAQYITPHEYAWCTANPTQCNMYNNVSYRQYTVSGTTSFTFSAAAATVRQKPAITYWPGATFAEIKPAQGVDGIGILAYKVTNPSAGVWHYEYAIYNQNIDRAISSFSIPLGNGITLTNLGFHMPPQQPGTTYDGTDLNAGFSSTPWASSNTGSAITWAADSFASNPNSNAIRWGTMYNFRFDSNRPPQAVNATLGFLKTGAPVTIAVQGPTADVVPSMVTISGRVLNGSGMGVSGSRVTLVDGGQGSRRVAISNAFGYYSFENVSTGQSYTLSVAPRFFTYNDMNITPTGNITDADFTPVP